MPFAGSAHSSSSQPWPFRHYSGLFFDESITDSAWIREKGLLELPPLEGVHHIVIRGAWHPNHSAQGLETGSLQLIVRTDTQKKEVVKIAEAGPFAIKVALPSSAKTAKTLLSLQLKGVELTNLLAWAGRTMQLSSLQRFRKQNKNRQLRITSVETDGGEMIFDFGNRHAPYNPAFVRAHARLAVNIVGFLTADLGVGESARCMVRAADTAQIQTALVPLKLNCKNPLGDMTYATRLQETNPHPVNVVHLDPPASQDIDHYHGRGFRAGKYNIAYWAWELPDFPDAWIPPCRYFDEIWCPSDFVRQAISLKVPLPVLTMPHAINFARPTATTATLRARFALPADAFLFLFLYDLNSYSERKNPRGALEAFRRSGLGQRGAGLVIKVHNVKGNEADFGVLQASVADLPGVHFITETLSRAAVYELEAACDCFVSLHRSEGFGLALAESMYLGKPVIATDWSASAEFIDATNGCPVQCTLKTLERNHGPYAKGQVWAEANLDHAADQMERLFDNRALASRLGESARSTIERKFSPAVIGARYRRRLENIASW